MTKIERFYHETCLNQGPKMDLLRRLAQETKLSVWTNWGLDGMRETPVWEIGIPFEEPVFRGESLGEAIAFLSGYHSRGQRDNR